MQGETDMSATTNERLMVTMAEAAKMLSVSRDTLRRLIRAGQIKGTIYGGRYWRLSIEELRRYASESAETGR